MDSTYKTFRELDRALFQENNMSIADNYTGNRKLYDDVYKRKKYKNAIFEGKATTKDYITGETLHINRKMADNKYGKARANYHTGQVDHIVPLEQVHSTAKKIGHLTDVDVRAVANREWNYRLTQSHLNQSKQSKSNFEVAQQLLSEGKYEESAKLIGDGVVAYSGVGAELTVRAAKNTGEAAVKNAYRLVSDTEKQLEKSVKELHQKYGKDLQAAAVPLVISSVNAIISVAKDKKTLREAGKDVVIQTGSAVAKTKVQEMGINAANHALKQSGIKVLEQAAKANVIAHAVTMGMMVKDSVVEWLDGKIDDAEFVKQVSRKGTLLAVETVGAVIGQTIIPIPLLGSFVGSMVASVACGCVFSLMDAAQHHLAEDKRKLAAKIAREAIEEMDYQQSVLKKYIVDDAQKWNDNVKKGFSLIATGTKDNDMVVIAGGLNCILTNFSQHVKFSSLEEFDEFFMAENAVLEL